MLKDSRSLCLDVCDYENNVVCNIYDSTADISGQATDVFFKTERNGWKELTFKLPTTCLTADGEERNFRLDSLIADYRIRTQTQTTNSEEIETDWYLISEPKIIHDKFSKNVEVTAGHICQLLKTKNLGLEFSDEEGNNTGTARQLLQAILDGTGWKVGEIAEFVEENEPDKIKVRSLTASSKTGAFKLISTMCEKFDAKPIYHGDTRTVDIVPMNPFSEVVGAEIPQEVLDGENVLELHYNNNISKIDRKIDTQNLITRLYAYGSYGDHTTGYCSLSECTHLEYTFYPGNDYVAGQEYSFMDLSRIRYYFVATNPVSRNSSLIWSELDPLSKMYVYDGAYDTAYKVYKEPMDPRGCVYLDGEPQKVKNKFDYIMDFSYYDKVNLLSDAMFQRLASHQRKMTKYLDDSFEAAAALGAYEEELSDIAESNTGFLRLSVLRYEEGRGRELKLVLNKDLYQDGIIYRSDYREAKRNYFSWYCAEQLKDNGDPVSGPASVVYIIHDTEPVTWEKAYVKYIDDEPKTHEYGTINSVDPSSVTLWMAKSEMGDVQPTENDRFYLFCTNSNSGRLGVRESELESVEQTLQNTTKIITEHHPTYFVWDDEPQPNTYEVRSSYGWYYRSYSNNLNPGDLYFCYHEVAWHPVLLRDEEPIVQDGSYYFNMRSRKLFHGELGEWIWLEDLEGERLAQNFSKVAFYCLKHDMLYKGIHDKYLYRVTEEYGLYPGNYAIENEFGFYWVFSSDMHVSRGEVLRFDTVRNLIYASNNEAHIVKPEAKPFDTIDFPVADMFEDIGWTQGTLNKETGTEVGSTSLYRSNNITVYPDVAYEYNVPAGGFLVQYNSKRRYVGWNLLNGAGQVKLDAQTKYVRFVFFMPPDRATNYFRVVDYKNSLFISNKEYRILSSDRIETDEGSQRMGIMYLIKKFADIADQCYQYYYPQYKEAQRIIKEKEDMLSSELGDLYREGYWQDNDYVDGDEDRLYTDSIDNLVKIAQPEITYNITFLDLYNSNHDVGFSIDGTTEDVEWPDVQITDAVHLIDEDIDVNCWAFIDKIEKCYDKPWQTKLEINTNLSLIAQHSFTDVLTHIAEVASEVEAKQTLYRRAAALTGTGKMTADRLEGAIQTNKNMITGGASNWYTDQKGNIILEAADGQSAMMLSGAGWAVANSKDSWGTWDFRYTTTGQGMTADFISAGTISGVLIEAGSIRTDQINASVGQELDIGSNKSLMLYATVDGLRPAGGLQTQVSNADGTYRPVEEGDSYIQISAKEGDNPAFIDIMTGGVMTLQGSTMNIKASSNMNIEGSIVTVKSDSDMIFNSGGSFSVESTGEFLVDSRNFSIKIDDTVEGGYKVCVEGKLTSSEGEIAGFTLTEVDKGKETNRKFMYVNGTDSLTSTSPGIYFGTDGINVGGGRIVYSIANKALNVNAEYVTVGKQSNGSGTLLAIDAKDGTIGLLAESTVNILAQSTVTIAGGETVNLVAGNKTSGNQVVYGKVLLGNTSKPFTVSADSTNSFIRNGMTALTDTTNEGIYLGTDGIALGKGLFKVDSKGALEATSALIFGEIIASTGRIGGYKGTDGKYTGGWVISADKFAADNGTVVFSSTGNYRIYAGSSDPNSAAFWVMNTGSIKATLGSIAGWTIDTEKMISSNKLVGINSTPGTDNKGIAFYAGNETASSAPFKVNHKGDMTATSAVIKGTVTADTGYIGGENGWVIVENQFYSKNQITGISSVEGTNNIAFWAGKASNKQVSEAPFRVTHGGKLTATEVDISGKIYSEDADVKGTIRAKSLYVGSNAQTLVAIDSQSGKIVLDSTDLAYIGASNSGIYITPTSIAIATSGTFQLKSTNFEVTTTGVITAKSGTIGAWSIGEKELTSDNGYVDYSDGMGNVSTYVGLSADPANAYAIWAGSSTAGNAPFRVRRNGLVYLTKVVDLDQNNNEKVIDLGKYSLGKLQYSTVKSVGSDGTVTLSNGTTFKSARSVEPDPKYGAEAFPGVTIQTNYINYAKAQNSLNIPMIIYLTNGRSFSGRISIKDGAGSGYAFDAGQGQGWERAARRVSFPTSNSKNSFTFKAPDLTNPGNGNTGTDRSGTYYVYQTYNSKDDYYVYVKGGVNNTTIAKLVPYSIYAGAFKEAEKQYTRTALTLEGKNVSLSLQGDTGPKLSYYSNIQLYYKSGTSYYKTTDGAKKWYYESTSGTQYYKKGSTSYSYYASGTSYSSTNSPYYKKS